MIRSKHAARPHPHQCWPVRWFGMIWLCGWRRFGGRDVFGQNNLQDPQIEELWFATQTSPQPVVTSDNPNFPAKFSWNLGPMDLTPMKPWSTWWFFFAANLPDISGRRPSGGPSGSRPAPSGAGQYDASAKSMAGGWINGDGSMMKPTRYGMFIRKIGGRDNW